MIFSSDIIMVGYSGIDFLVMVAVYQVPFQYVFDHGIVDPWSLQGPAAGCFQSLFTIFFLKHQHTKTGFVILFDIDTVFQHQRSCLSVAVPIRLACASRSSLFHPFICCIRWWCGGMCSARVV